MCGEAMSMGHQVFLSYAGKDEAAASHVCEILEKDGVQCWLGVRDLQEGSDRAAAVLEAICSRGVEGKRGKVLSEDELRERLAR